LDKIINRIYEDHILGKLTEERFNKMLTGYEAEQAELNTKAETLRSEVEELKRKTANLQSFLKLVERFGEIPTLTEEVARTFIERIEIHEAVYNKLKPKTKDSQKVDIFLTYIGRFDNE